MDTVFNRANITFDRYRDLVDAMTKEKLDTVFASNQIYNLYIGGKDANEAFTELEKWHNE